MGLWGQVWFKCGKMEQRHDQRCPNAHKTQTEARSFQVRLLIFNDVIYGGPQLDLPYV